MPATGGEPTPSAADAPWTPVGEPTPSAADTPWTPVGEPTPSSTDAPWTPGGAPGARCDRHAAVGDHPCTGPRRPAGRSGSSSSSSG